MKRYPSADPCRPGPPPCPPPGCFPPPGCCPPRCREQGSYPVPVVFVPGRVYYAGQVVLYGDDFYVVNENDPRGLPGSSDGFTRIAMGYGGSEEGRWGPTGPTGPAGPAGGEPGATGPTEAGRMRRSGEIFDALLVQREEYTILTLFCAPVGIFGELGADGFPLRRTRGNESRRVI